MAIIYPRHSPNFAFLYMIVCRVVSSKRKEKRIKATLREIIHLISMQVSIFGKGLDTTEAYRSTKLMLTTF